MKTKSEIILDNKYYYIMKRIETILELAGLDKNIIEDKLNSGKILQTELDYILLELIDDITEYYKPIVHKGVE